MAWQGRLIDASAAGTNDKASCSAPILITYPSPTVDRSAVRYWAPDLQVPLPDRHHTAVRGCRRVTRDLDETVADVGQDRRLSRGDVQSTSKNYCVQLVRLTLNVVWMTNSCRGSKVIGKPVSARITSVVRINRRFFSWQPGSYRQGTSLS